jgi:hypothetical protein
MCSPGTRACLDTPEAGWAGACASRVIFTAAVVAIRYNPVIKTFYQRLCQAGKVKQLALKACMRKLLTILNAMLKNGMPWRVASVSLFDFQDSWLIPFFALEPLCLLRAKTCPPILEPRRPYNLVQ